MTEALKHFDIFTSTYDTHTNCTNAIAEFICPFFFRFFLQTFFNRMKFYVLFIFQMWNVYEKKKNAHSIQVYPKQDRNSNNFQTMAFRCLAWIQAPSRWTKQTRCIACMRFGQFKRYAILCVTKHPNAMVWSFSIHI